MRTASNAHWIAWLSASEVARRIDADPEDVAEAQERWDRRVAAGAQLSLGDAERIRRLGGKVEWASAPDAGSAS